MTQKTFACADPTDPLLQGFAGPVLLKVWERFGCTLFDPTELTGNFVKTILAIPRARWQNSEDGCFSVEVGYAAADTAETIEGDFWTCDYDSKIASVWVSMKLCMKDTLTLMRAIVAALPSGLASNTKVGFKGCLINPFEIAHGIHADTLVYTKMAFAVHSGYRLSPFSVGTADPLGLFVSNCVLDVDSTAVLLASIKWPTLKYVKIHDTTSPIFGLIMSHLSLCRSLLGLVLSHCGITDRDFNRLIGYLRDMPIRKINLSHNALTDRTCRRLAAALPRLNPRLELISVYNNSGVTSAGVQALVTATQQSARHRHVKIWHESLVPPSQFILWDDTIDYKNEQ